ncbi:hypothetical protein Tco_0231206 [Tanacetum coccineum]
MHTRSQSRNLHHQQQQASPPVAEPFNLEEPIENPAPPLAPMDDTQTMAQLLEAPTAGYEDAIVVPEIIRINFELKPGWLNIVQNKQFYGHEQEILMPTSVISTDHFYVKLRSVRVRRLKICFSIFPRGAARIWLEKATPSLFNICLSSSRYQAPAPQIQVYQKEISMLRITNSSGVAYMGPIIHTTSSPKVVEREPKVTKDMMPPTNNGSTKDVQPLVVPIVHHESISEPVNAPVSASMPNQKASIPFPSRRNDERRREKANDQIEKLYEIFRDLSFEISFMDALMLMPKFASTLKTLIGNKEKLSEMARTPLNENCSAVI